MLISYIVFMLSVALIFMVDRFYYRRPWHDPLYLYLVVVTMYVSPLSVRYLLNMPVSGDVTYMFEEIRGTFPYALILTALANCVFYLFYLVSRPGRLLSGVYRSIRGVEDTRPSYFSAALVLFLFGLLLFLKMAWQFGSVVDFMRLGYGVTSFLSLNPLLATSIPIMYVAAFFFFMSYVTMKRRDALIVSLLLMALLNVLEIYLSRRGELAVWNLAYVINFSLLKFRIRFYMILPAIVAGFVFLNFLGVVRSSNYSSLDSIVLNAEEVLDDTQGVYPFAYTIIEGQFAVPFETLPVLMQTLPSDKLRFGSTLLESASQWVPRFVWPDKGYGLGSWYYKTYYDPNAEPQYGRGFFYLSEGYLNFGLVGVLLWAALWGWLWKAVRSLSDARTHCGERRSVIGCFIYSYYVACMVKLVVSSSGGFFVAVAKESVVWAVVGLVIALASSTLLRWLHVGSPVAVDSSGR